MAEDPNTISSDKLCAITGLTDRRHRQLAKDGHFPPPMKGRYQTAATLRGLFTYYRNINQRDMKSRKLEEEHRKLKIANDYKESKLVMRDKVVASITRILARVDQVLEQKLANEYPAAVAGLDVPQARVYGKRLGDQIRRLMQEMDKEWR